MPSKPDRRPDTAAVDRFIFTEDHHPGRSFHCTLCAFVHHPRRAFGGAAWSVMRAHVRHEHPGHLRDASLARQAVARMQIEDDFLSAGLPVPDLGRADHLPAARRQQLQRSEALYARSLASDMRVERWLEWKGDPHTSNGPDVDPSTPIEVRLRNGSRLTGYPPDFDWTYHPASTPVLDVIAWRPRPSTP